MVGLTNGDLDELRRQSGINGDTDIKWKAADEIQRIKAIPQELRNQHFSHSQTDMVGDQERREGYLKALADVINLINQQYGGSE